MPDPIDSSACFSKTPRLSSEAPPNNMQRNSIRLLSAGRRLLSTAVADAPVAKPAVKPASPNFSSGPCAKRPGYSLANLAGAPLGRSHRAKVGKAKLGAAIQKTRELLEPAGLPSDYFIGIVPAEMH